MRPGVALVSLGCRVNRVESDRVALALEQAGVPVVDSCEAPVIVINTCAVTGEAEAKTRKSIRHAAALPQQPTVIATGCVASLFADELVGLGPRVIVEADKTRVADRALQELELQGYALQEGSCVPERGTATGRSRPGIKIQDGCDNRCTYCIVWKARGRGRSLPVEQVLDQVRQEVSRGAQEVVLTGINVGRYETRDKQGRKINLAQLLSLICDQTGISRIRISSIEPPDVDADLLEAMADHGDRVAPFLHICLQSGCDATLRRMGRPYDTRLFRERVQLARTMIPNLSLGTDLIVGFPGESAQEFDESLAFCREMRFSRMHVFRYSRRPGTPAAEASGQVDPQTKAFRSEEARKLASEMRAVEAASKKGQEELVVVQAPGRAVSGGLFDVLVDPELSVGSLARVRVRGVVDPATLDARTPIASRMR